MKGFVLPTCSVASSLRGPTTPLVYVLLEHPAIPRGNRAFQHLFRSHVDKDSVWISDRFIQWVKCPFLKLPINSFLHPELGAGAIRFNALLAIEAYNGEVSQ